MDTAFTLQPFTDQPIAENISEKKEDLSLRPFLYVEANLATIPWVQFGRNLKSEAKDKVIFRYSTLVNGGLLKCSVIVSMADFRLEDKKPEKQRGSILPTQFDHDVYMCVMDLWDEQGRSPEGKICFRITDICKRLLVNGSGKNYQLIKDSIQRLLNVRIHSDKAFYSTSASERITATFSLFDGKIHEVVRSKNGQKTTRSKGKAEGTVELNLSRVILDNLKNNYATKLTRIVYQHLNNGFAKKLFSLVAHKEQIDHERRSFDFDPFYLADILPITGVKHLSTIKVRLKPALEELKEKKLFHYEYITQDQNEVLRLIPVHEEKDYIGSSALKKFLGNIYEAYKGKDLTEVLGISEDAILGYLEKDDRVKKINGVSYSHVYYALHVAFHQVLHGTPIKKSLGGFVSHMLKSKDIQQPLGWKPLHVMQIELAKKAAVNPETTYSKAEESVVECEIKKKAKSYVNLLSLRQYDEYIEEIKTGSNDFLKTQISRDLDSAPLFHHIVSLIERDIRNGKEIKLEDMVEVERKAKEKMLHLSPSEVEKYLEKVRKIDSSLFANLKKGLESVAVKRHVKRLLVK